MKNLFFLFVILITSLQSNSQINAVTSDGKKIILNTDGTWKYVDGTPNTKKACEESNTGNLSIKNNTDTSIYFYYTTGGRSSRQNKFIKVKAKSTKSVNDLESGYGSRFRYEWKAAKELYPAEIEFGDIQGIENGEFIVNVCALTEVEVDN